MDCSDYVQSMWSAQGSVGECKLLEIPDIIADDDEEFIIASKGSVDKEDLEEVLVMTFSL
jgi:hypothetical protein